MGEILETGVIDSGNINGAKVTCNEMCYTELEAFPIMEGFTIADAKEVVFNGNPEQIAEMLDDYSKYFEEVTNPENSASNPFFKSKYSPLSEVLNVVRPIMGKYGFGILQSPKMSESGMVQVQTILTHRSGATISFPSIEARPAKADVQGIMSIITYLRRASVNAILGVCGEPDDDGNSSSNKKEKPPVKNALTPEQSEMRKTLIQLCSDISAKSPDNKKKIVDALKAVEPTGNINKLRSDEDFTKATEIVNGLGL